MKGLRKGKEHYEHFGYLEYIDHCSNGKRPKGKEYIESQNGDSDFHGTKTYAEAENYARYGWDAGMKQLKSDETMEVIGNVHTTYGLAGGVVDVTRFLSGEPEYMVSHVDEVDRNKDDLTLIVPLDYNCSFTAENGLQFTMSILKIINEIQKNYNIRLIGVYTSSFSNVNSICSILIKDYDEPMVLNSMAFSLHPGFFRRINFKWIEMQDYCEPGYGVPISNGGPQEIHKFLKKGYLEWMNIDQYYLLPCLGSDNTYEALKPQIIKVTNEDISNK
jgi:hypothetical protein